MKGMTLRAMTQAVNGIYLAMEKIMTKRLLPLRLTAER